MENVEGKPGFLEREEKGTKRETAYKEVVVSCASHAQELAEEMEEEVELEASGGV